MLDESSFLGFPVSHYYNNNKAWTIIRKHTIKGLKPPVDSIWFIFV